MSQLKRRYTTIAGADWIVTATYDADRIARDHWFEVKIEATEEQTGRKYAFPPEIGTFRFAEAEHPFRYLVDRDWDGNREAAIDHVMGTVYRRVYSYIERGH